MGYLSRTLGGLPGVSQARSWMNERDGGEWDPNRQNFGLPGYEGMRSQYGDLLGQGPRGAPQAGGSSFRGNQAGLVGMLEGQARGQGPGQEIARQQAEQQTDRGLGQQLAMARGGRPGGGAMAARNAAMASGQLQGQGAQAATMGGLAAQQSAIGQLGGVLQGARGQDQNLALQNARLQFDTMGLDDARQMELLRQQLAMARAEQQGGQAYEGALGQKYAADGGRGQNRWGKALGMAQGLGQAYLATQGGGLAGAGSQALQQRGPGYGSANPNTQGGMDRYGPYGQPAGHSQYSDANLGNTLGLGGGPQVPQVDAVGGGSLGYQSGSEWNRDWQ